MIRTDDELLAARARRALRRPGAHIEETAGGYLLRSHTDRRRGPVLALDEAVFRALLAAPGLRARPGGGWVPAARAALRDEVGEGCAHVVEERTAPEGGRRRVAVNPRTSALEWLARRRDRYGEPWLTRAQLLAAEQLKEDHRRGGVLGRLTMDWRFQARSSGQASGPALLADAAVEARRRVQDALGRLPVQDRAIVSALCLREVSLREVEQELGLAARSARAALRRALENLVVVYGICPRART